MWEVEEIGRALGAKGLEIVESRRGDDPAVKLLVRGRKLCHLVELRFVEDVSHAVIRGVLPTPFDEVPLEFVNELNNCIDLVKCYRPIEAPNIVLLVFHTICASPEMLTDAILRCEEAFERALDLLKQRKEVRYEGKVQDLREERADG